jgi:hypothetical protein
MSSNQTGNQGNKDQAADHKATGGNKQSEADGSRNAATGNASATKTAQQDRKVDQIDSSGAKGNKPARPGGRP